LQSKLLQKDFPHQATSAPGGKIERRLRQALRPRARLKILDQPAVDERRDHGAQKRHGGGNAEDAHEPPDSN
jgi:hypothetical protein